MPDQTKRADNPAEQKPTPEQPGSDQKEGTMAVVFLVDTKTRRRGTCVSLPKTTAATLIKSKKARKATKQDLGIAGIS